jgi:hypothetical protein
MGSSSVEAPLPGQIHLRYNNYAVEGHSVPLPTTPPTTRGMGNMNMMATPPPGATLGLITSATQKMYAHTGSSRNSPSFIGTTNSGNLAYISTQTGKYMTMDRRMEMNISTSEILLVSPGLPTPAELSIYENKQPTGFLHVTCGNQTVEFFDGVANMPKRM